ncbi:thiolase family protein [Caballeronia calidae]|uniref:Thiolase family protein n=1 Tax=Caballeronia calidae TaxID=1777139 RepID=A0A158E4E2_9BURK|nr:thiolase family protein [Caballeronia calidae]SAL01719.1 thiolase family protein [Caballeronia calidae]
MPNLDRLKRLSDEVAIVGIGDTDYATDYVRSKEFAQRKRADPTIAPGHDAYTFATRALKRALDDCGLDVSDIDGLVVGPTLSIERTGEVLGIESSWSSQADAVNAIVEAASAIHAGLAECVALVYGNDQRSNEKQYGGPTAEGARFRAYVNYAPWGMTSQGGFYAMMTQRYMALHNVSEADLARISVAQRKFAQLNDNAIMRQPLAVADYLSARYICEPLRLPDYCLVNDGGVALILTTAERAKRMRQSPVLITGISRSDMNRDATSLRPRLIDFYHTAHRSAAQQAYEMAGFGPSDIGMLQVYDSFSPHVLFALEGFGFCPIGEGARFIANGKIEPGGSLPVNTSGGHLSESYMQGWNHQVESVRQLRGHAGKRQVENLRRAQYISDVAGKVASVIYTRGSK